MIVNSHSILTSVPTVSLHEELAYHHIFDISTVKADVHASCSRLLRFSKPNMEVACHLTLGLCSSSLVDLYIRLRAHSSILYYQSNIFKAI